MFEDSLFSSQPQPASARRRWTTAASIGIQCAVAGLIIAIPMLSPDTLHSTVTPPAAVLFMHREPPPPPKPIPVQLTQNTSNALTTPTRPTVELVHSSLPGRPAAAADDGPAPLLAMNTGMGTGGGISSITGTGSGSGPRVSAESGGGGGRPGKPLTISSGVTAGLLLAPMKPIYPRIAIAAHIQGTIVLSAIIDKSGKITALQVVTGPEMLRAAALDAVRVARYRPFLLNGEPTEVQTTISVNFRMDGQA